MKGRKQGSDSVFVSRSRRPRGGQQEIKNFLRALSSYPDQFARNPYMSFEEHFSAIAAGSGGEQSQKSAA